VRGLAAHSAGDLSPAKAGALSVVSAIDRTQSYVDETSAGPLNRWQVTPLPVWGRPASGPPL